MLVSDVCQAESAVCSVNCLNAAFINSFAHAPKSRLYHFDREDLLLALRIMEPPLFQPCFSGTLPLHFSIQNHDGDIFIVSYRIFSGSIDSHCITISLICDSTTSINNPCGSSYAIGGSPPLAICQYESRRSVLKTPICCRRNGLLLSMIVRK